MDKDSKGRRKMEDSGGGLLPAVEGHSLEYNGIVTLRLKQHIQFVVSPGDSMLTPG